MKLKALAILILFTSCEISKKASKTKTDRTLTEQVKTTSFRKGDTITINVPNVKYKDTVIERVSYKNNTPSIARITYDKDGNASFECLQAQIEQTNEINRQLIELVKDKGKEKTEEIPTSVILYAFIGFALFIVIVLFFMSRMFKKQLDAFTPQS